MQGQQFRQKELLRSAFAELEGCSLGNPHSGGSSESMLEEARCLVLNYFDAPLDEYDCVFTPGCSAGMKVIGGAISVGFTRSHGVPRGSSYVVARYARLCKAQCQLTQ